jgi:hypothetical protein
MTFSAQANVALAKIPAEGIALIDLRTTEAAIEELTDAGLIEVIPAEDTCGGEAWPHRPAL